MTMISTVSGTLKTSMDTKVLTMVMEELSIWGILWLIIWRRVSVSLV